jgi:hypothetical protein
MLKDTRPLFKELNLPIFGYIYKFENKKTGRVYIGQTIQPLNMRYRTDIIQGWIRDRKRKRTQKFAEELIEEDFEVTESLDIGFCRYHLDKLEIHYINKYNAYENGYNNCVGYWKRNDGIEEFENILKEYNLEYINGELRRICDE